jgi:hypothetical protein
MRRALIESVFLHLRGDWETERNENGCARRRDRSDYGRAPEHLLRLGQRRRSGKPPTGIFGGHSRTLAHASMCALISPSAASMRSTASEGVIGDDDRRSANQRPTSWRDGRGTRCRLGPSAIEVGTCSLRSQPGWSALGREPSQHQVLAAGTLLPCCGRGDLSIGAAASSKHRHPKGWACRSHPRGLANRLW